LEISKWLTLRLKEWDFILWLEFLKIKETCKEKVAGEQDLSLQQYFP